MVKIRLQRAGAKKAPFYHIVVADSRSPRDGRIVEKIGTYDPMTNPATINLDKEKVATWIKKWCKANRYSKSFNRESTIIYVWMLLERRSCMEEILKTIIESLVDNKEQVQITRTDDEKGILLKVKVADEDMGKVIGKQGKNAKAIRTVMKAITAKEHKKVGIIFEE